MRLKIGKMQLVVAIIVLLQLMSSQLIKYYPGMPGLLFQPVYYMKYIGPLFMMVLYLTKKKDHQKREKVRQYVNIFIPLFVMYLLIELLAMTSSPVVATYGLRYWTRFIAFFLDKVFVLVEVSCLYHLCGEKSIRYLESALLLDGLFVLLMSIARAGVGQTLMAFPAIFGIVSDNSAVGVLEVHELTYCFALCIIYHLFFKKTKEKHDLRLLIIMILLFISGGKRIAFLGIILSGVFAFFVHRKGLRKSTLLYVGFAGVIICMVWNLILYDGRAMLYFQVHNINVMGRDAIYAYFLNRTRFSPSFLGWGMSATTKAIENMTRAEVGNMVNIRGLHNDILRIYIECGFFGSILWYCFNLVHVPLKLFSKFGKKDATLYMTLIIFAFTTYLTSNTEGSFVFQTILLLIPLSIGSQQMVEQTNNTGGSF